MRKKKDPSGNEPPRLELKSERLFVARKKKKEEELDFTLWKLGIGPGELEHVKLQALSRGLSVQVYVREHMGITLPGGPVVKVHPSAEPSEQFVLENELNWEAAWTIQRSRTAVRYFDRIIIFQDCETYSDLEKQINRIAEEMENEHGFNQSVCIAHFRRIPNARFQVTFRVSPHKSSWLWRYAVRVFRVRKMDDVPLVLSLLNGDIHTSAELVSYAYLSRFPGFRLVAIFRCPTPKDSLLR